MSPSMNAVMGSSKDMLLAYSQMCWKKPCNMAPVCCGRVTWNVVVGLSVL